MVMNRLYFLYRSPFRSTSPYAPRSKQVLSRATTLMLSLSGMTLLTLVSPLRMKMKSAASCRPCLTKNCRFSRPASDSA